MYLVIRCTANEIHIAILKKRGQNGRLWSYIQRIFSYILLVLVEKCREVLDKRDYAGILLNDLSKAFNCINHELLIAKVHTYAFSLESLTFIQSYLTNQIQTVKINSWFSEYSNIESGVPQGSISGQLFFNIFI